MEFRRPDNLHRAGLQPDGTELNVESDDTMASLDLYIETLEADKREEKTWLPPPSPMHSSDSNFDIYSGLDIGSKTSSELYNLNCKPFSYKNQLLGSLGSRASPQYNDRSHDCDFASPKPSQSDRESDHSDREQDAGGISTRQRPSTAAGTSWDLQESLQSSSILQRSEFEDGRRVEKKTIEQEPASSSVVDPLTGEKASCSKNGKEAEVVLASTGKDYNDLLEKYRILRGNMLSLLRTAQAELQSKTDTITELREDARCQHKMLGRSQARSVDVTHTSMQTEPVSSVASSLVGSSQQAHSKKTTVGIRCVLAEPAPPGDVTTQCQYKSASCRNMTVQTEPRLYRNLSVQTKSSICMNRRIQTEPAIGSSMHCQTEPTMNRNVRVQTEPVASSGISVQTETVGAAKDEQSQTDSCLLTSSHTQTETETTVKPATSSRVIQITTDLQLASPPAHSTPSSQLILTEDELVDVEDTVTSATPFHKTVVTKKGVSTTDSVPELETPEAVEIASVALFLETVASDKVGIVMDEPFADRKSSKVKETCEKSTSVAYKRTDSSRSRSTEDILVSSTFVKTSRKRRCTASPRCVTSGKKGRKEKCSSSRNSGAGMPSTSLESSLAVTVPKVSGNAQAVKSSSKLGNHGVHDDHPDSKTNADCSLDTVPPAIQRNADDTPTVFSSKAFSMEKDKDCFRGVLSVTPGEVLTIDLSVNEDDIHNANAVNSDEELVPSATTRNLKPQASTTAILQEEHRELGSFDLQDDPRGKKFRGNVENADMDQEPQGKISDNVSIQSVLKLQNRCKGQDGVIDEDAEHVWDKDTKQFDKFCSVSEHGDHTARPMQDVSGEKQNVFRLPTPLRLTQSNRPCTAYLSPIQAVTPPHPDQAKVTGGPFAAVKGDAWKRKLLLWVDYSHKRVSRRQEIDAVFTGQHSPQIFDWVNIPSKSKVSSPRIQDTDHFTGLVGPEIGTAVANEDGAVGRARKVGSSYTVDSKWDQQLQPCTRESHFSAEVSPVEEIQADNEPHQEWFEYSKGKDQQCNEAQQFVEGCSETSRVSSHQKQGKKLKPEKAITSAEQISEKKNKPKKKKKVKTKKDKSKNRESENVQNLENVNSTSKKGNKVKSLGEKGTDKSTTRDDEISKTEDANKLENGVLQKDTERCEEGTGGNKRCDEVTDLRLVKKEPFAESSLVLISQSDALPSSQAAGESLTKENLSAPSSHPLCSTSTIDISGEKNKNESVVCEEGNDEEDDDKVFVVSDTDSASAFTDVENSSPRKQHKEPRLVSGDMEYSASEDDYTQNIALVPEIQSFSAFKALYASQTFKNFETLTRQSGEQPSEKDKPELGVHEQTVVDSSGKSQFQDIEFEKLELSSAQDLPSKDIEDDVFSSSPTYKHNHFQVTPVKERCTRSESSAAVEMKDNGTPETKPLAFRQALLSSPSVIWSPEKTSYNVISTREPVNSHLFHSLAGFSIIGSSEDTSTSNSGSVSPSLQQKKSAEIVSCANDTFIEDNSKNGILAATEHAVSASYSSEVTSKSCPKSGHCEQSSSSSSERKAERPVDDDEITVSKEKCMENGDKVQSEAPGGVHQGSDNAPLFGYPSLTRVCSGPSKLSFQYKRAPNFLVSSSSSTSATSATSLESSSTTSVLSSSSSSSTLLADPHPQLSKHSISATKQLETVGEEGSNQGSTGFDVNVHNIKKNICPSSVSSSTLLSHVPGVTPPDDTNKKLDTKERAPNFDAYTQKISSPLNDGGVEKTSKDSSHLLVSAVQSFSVTGAESKIRENLAPYPPEFATQSKNNDSLVTVASSLSDPDLEDGELLETSSSSAKPEDQHREPQPVLGTTEETLEEGEIRCDGFSPVAPVHTDEPTSTNNPNSSAQTLEPVEGDNAQFSDLREHLQHKKDKSLDSLSRNSTSTPDPPKRNRERAVPVLQSKKPNIVELLYPVAGSFPPEGDRIKKKKAVSERNPSRSGKLSHSIVDSTNEEDKELEILKQKIRVKQDKLRRLIVSQHNTGSMSDSDNDDSGPSLKKYTIPKVGKKNKAGDSRAVPKARNSNTKHIKPTSISHCQDKLPREPPNGPSSQTSHIPSASPSFKHHQSVSQSEKKNEFGPKNKGRNTSPLPKQTAKCGTNQASTSRSASQGSIQHSDSSTMSQEQGSQRGVLSHSVSDPKPAVAQGARNRGSEVVHDDCMRDSEEIDVVNHCFVELETNKPSSELEGCSRTRVFDYFRDPYKVRPQIKEFGDDENDEGTDEEHSGDDESGGESNDDEQAGNSDGESNDNQQTTDTESEDPQEKAGHEPGEEGCENMQQFDSIGHDLNRSGHVHGADALEKKEKIQIQLETENKSELTCSSDNGTESDKDTNGHDLGDTESEGAYYSDTDEEKTAGNSKFRMKAKLEQAKCVDHNSADEISDGCDAVQTSTAYQTHKYKQFQGNTKFTLATSASHSGSINHPTNIWVSKESSVDCLSLDAFAFNDSHILLEQSEDEYEKSSPRARGGTENRKKGNEQTAKSASLQGGDRHKDTAKTSDFTSFWRASITTAVENSVSERSLSSKSDTHAKKTQISGSNKRNSRSRGQRSNSPDSGSENNQPKRPRGRNNSGSSCAKFQRSSSEERKPLNTHCEPGSHHSDTAHHHHPDSGHRSSCCTSKKNERSNTCETSSDRQGQKTASSSSRQKQSTDGHGKSPGGSDRSGEGAHRHGKSPGGSGRSGEGAHRQTAYSPHLEDQAESCRCCGDRSGRRSPSHGRHKTTHCQDTRRSSRSQSRSHSREPVHKRAVFGNRHSNFHYSRSQSKSPRRERRLAHSGHSCEKHHHRHQSRTRSRERNLKEHSSHMHRDSSDRGRSGHERRFYRESSRSPRREHRCSCDECLPSHSQSGRCHGENRRSRSRLCHSGWCSKTADLYRKDRRQNVYKQKKRGRYHR